MQDSDGNTNTILAGVWTYMKWHKIAQVALNNCGVLFSFKEQSASY